MTIEVPPWTRPDISPRGDASPEMIYRYVPGVLQKWELLELSFAGLLAFLCETDSPAIGRVYGSISNANGRRQALKAAASVFFNVDRRAKPSLATMDALTGLLNRYSRAGELRNNVAHSLGAIELAHFGVNGVFLVPNVMSTGKFKSHDDFLSMTYRYNASDLWEMMDHFTRIGNGVGEFMKIAKADYLDGAAGLQSPTPETPRSGT